MNPTNGSLGDIYVVTAKSREHPVTSSLDQDGFVFSCKAQRCTFPDGLPHADPISAYTLSTRNVDQNHFYYDVVPTFSHARTEPTAQPPAEPTGIFIPRGMSKKLVADDLRQRFGGGTILLKPPVADRESRGR